MSADKLSINTQLSLMLSLGIAKLIRQTLAGEIRIDSQHMVVLVFDASLLRLVPGLRNEIVEKQLWEENNPRGIIVVPQMKSGAIKLFPYLADITDGLIVQAILPCNSHQVISDARVIRFVGEGKPRVDRMVRHYQ